MNNEIKKLQKKLDKAEKKIAEYEQSPAMFVTRTLKQQCFRKDITIIILIVALLCSFYAYVRLSNDYKYTETTTSEVIDMDTQEGNNNYVGGDNSGKITNN